MPLTDLQIKRAQPRAKQYKLSDEKGLYLLVKTSGKYWRFDYAFAGKRKTEAFGVYPDITLAGAREKRDECRKMLANDIDPTLQRKAKKDASDERAGNSLEIVAREWFNMNLPTWTEGHSSKIIARLENDVFPAIGSRPIAEIAAPELLACLKRIEKRSIETAHRALSECSRIFRYAIATGRSSRNIASDLVGALASAEVKHFSAITDPKEVGPLLRKLHAYHGTPPVASGLRLAPLFFVRPGELRLAEWDQIDFDTAEWRFVSSKTKAPHVVPLATQAVEILRELHLSTGHKKYVFAGTRSQRPPSDNTFLFAMREMAISQDEMTMHGFRAMARTILDEVLGFRPDFIEHQLAHAVRDPNGRAYNRTAHLPERKKMMQQWADYLDGLRLQAVE
jgi:integrase